MEKKILFLDFDGVLFDTLKEVYLVNRYEYLKKDMLEPVKQEVYERYSKYKYLVYNIWMFYYYNPLIFNNEKVIEEKFLDAIQKRNIKEEEKFCESFLETRKKLVLDNYDFWKNLETPYDFFFEIKKLHEQGKKIVIVSKKNKTSILERFETYGLEFSEHDVFAREALGFYPSKGDFMTQYMTHHGYDRAIFVDDNNNNLKFNNPNIKTMLALWGNTQPKSQGYSQVQAIEEIKKFFDCI